MKLQTKITAFGILAAGAYSTVTACSSKTNPPAPTPTATSSSSSMASTTMSSSSSTGPGGMGGGGGMMMPPPPTLGAQIDRMGRPAINTVGSKTFIDAASRDAAENAYNADADPTKWSMHAADIATSLTVLDAADGVCGDGINAVVDQKFGKDPKMAGAYDALAGVLADDRLWVNTSSKTCGLYLAVEANFLGVMNPFCGGRTPLDPVIWESYSLLTGNAQFDLSKLPDQGPTTGAWKLTDGLMGPDPALVTAFKAFPYFAAKH